MDRTGHQMIAQLKIDRPDVVISIDRTVDRNGVWDGDEPIGDEFICYDHAVYARTIRNGVMIEGVDYLGGSWYDPNDKTPLNIDCLAEISGYLPQMIDEAIENMDRALREAGYKS